jgi:Flp pilus assembly pilin Flp
MTEYTVLVGFVALASIGAFIALGVALTKNFESRRELILYPSP